ncbi:MAG TPA: aa3-type cytochrome c oxidase subunit IV [Sphingomonas sp.]
MANGPGTQLKAHEQTYAGFLRLLKYGAIASFLIAALVVFLIAR